LLEKGQKTELHSGDRIGIIWKNSDDQDTFEVLFGVEFQIFADSERPEVPKETISTCLKIYSDLYSTQSDFPDPFELKRKRNQEDSPDSTSSGSPTLAPKKLYSGLKKSERVGFVKIVFDFCKVGVRGGRQTKKIDV
jgi:hypothetical protein